MKCDNNLRRLLGISKPVLVALLVIAVTLPLSMRSGDAETTGIPKVSSQVFGSIEEAQEVVPFKIATVPSVPEGMVLTGVGVTTTEGNSREENTRVAIVYQSAAGGMMQLIQNTMKATAHGPVSILSQADVDGARAQVITGSNAAGTQIGIVQWKSGDITYILIASHASGQSLVPLANTIQSD